MTRLILFVVGLVLPVLAYGVGWDCSKTTTRVQKVACHDAKLTHLGKEVDAAFVATLNDALHAEQSRQSQELWQESLETRCGSASSVSSCLMERYRKRLAILKLPIITAAAGQLRSKRMLYATSLLPNGKVLIAGGQVEGQPLASAMLFDPTTTSFHDTGSMLRNRTGPSAIVTRDSKVLIYGGYVGGVLTRSAELYDPISGSFSDGKVASREYIPPARENEGFLDLGRGKFLIMKGDINSDKFQVYDANAAHFSIPIGFINPRRREYTATILQDGKVLFSGGKRDEFDALADGEVLDPVKEVFTLTGKMPEGRTGHTATLLRNGKVLLVGGVNIHRPPTEEKPVVVVRSLLYDPTQNDFTASGETVLPRYGQLAILLRDGRVLIAGGADDVAAATAELYDPKTGQFALIGRLGFSINASPFDDEAGTATMLGDGRVLFISQGMAEIYDPNISRK